MRSAAYELALIASLVVAKASGVINDEMRTWTEPRLAEVPWRSFVWLCYVPVRVTLNVLVWATAKLDPRGNFALVVSALKAEAGA